MQSVTTSLMYGYFVQGNYKTVIPTNSEPIYNTEYEHSSDHISNAFEYYVLSIGRFRKEEIPNSCTIEWSS
jgi:hypothetical protein